MKERPSASPVRPSAALSIWRPAAFAGVLGMPFVVGCGGSSKPPILDPAPSPAVLNVSVAAHELDGRTLHYRWRASDGEVDDVDAAATTWRLPPGPGLHFMYVQVSNHAGGYVESRLVYSTDDSDTSTPTSAPRPVSPPPSGVMTGNSFRGVVWAQVIDSDPSDSRARNVYAPDASVYMVNESTGFQTQTVTTNIRGEFLIPNVPEGPYDILASLQGSAFVHHKYDTMRSDSTMVTRDGSVSGFRPNDPQVSFISGSVVMADLQPCGVDSPFFGTQVVPHVTLLGAGGAPLGSSVRANAMGDYALLYTPLATHVQITCEDLAAVVPVPAAVPLADYVNVPRLVFPATHTPLIDSMSASVAGQPAGAFLPPPSGLPSDAMGRFDAFLAYKGIDDRRSAAEYYVAIGAAASVDAEGRPVDPVSFDDWKRAVQMDPYSTGGGSEVGAAYINRVDLNLTRRHRSISYGPQHTAAYVCNHLGPVDDSQTAIDTAVENALDERNLVACVAMDYMVHPGTNGDRPFTRFFIFAPNGRLLSSVNLDGRGEKFVPGACVACHGGDNYLEKFGAGGNRQPDIGAHFLPYDTGNFAFAAQPGRREIDQAESIYQLNQNVLATDPTPAVQELIAGWYAGGSHALDKQYVPLSWAGLPATDVDWYRSIYAANCRTCHVAFTERYNLDHAENRGLPPGNILFVTFGQPTCGLLGHGDFLRNHTMPNSLVTFNRFWTSAGSAVDLPALNAQFWGLSAGCSLIPDPPH